MARDPPRQAKAWGHSGTITERRTEIINQFIRQPSDYGFIQGFGGRAIHKTDILSGYQDAIGIFRITLSKFSINDALDKFNKVILDTAYEDVDDAMIKFLKAKGVKEADQLIGRMYSNKASEFAKLLDAP